jgi:hypothetical protein
MNGAVGLGAGFLGLCILVGLGKMGRDLSRSLAASQRPRAPWERGC